MPLPIHHGRFLRCHLYLERYKQPNHDVRIVSLFSTSQKNDYYNPVEDYTPTKTEQTILLVGDGDLSNAALMSKDLKQTRSHVKLIASVLESEGEHNQGMSICLYI